MGRRGKERAKYRRRTASQTERIDLKDYYETDSRTEWKTTVYSAANTLIEDGSVQGIEKAVEFYYSL